MFVQFVQIANRQLNPNFIYCAEGALPGQSGKVRLAIEPRQAQFFAGAGEGIHLATPGSLDQPAILELSGAEAGRFREQWLGMTSGQSQSAAG